MLGKLSFSRKLSILISFYFQEKFLSKKIFQIKQKSENIKKEILGEIRFIAPIKTLEWNLISNLL